MGLYVEIGISYSNHTFRRISDAFVDTMVQSGDVTSAEFFPITSFSFGNLNYEDTQTAPVVIELAGGLCNRTLGDATVNVKLNTCPNYLQPLLIQTFQSPFALPAHQVSVTFSQLQTANVGFNLEVARYISATLNDTAYLDLRNATTIGSPTVRFEYHPQPTLTVTILGANTPTCQDAKQQPNAPLVISSMFVTNVTVYVTEVFPGVASCDYVTGSLTLTNLLGESQPDSSLSKCFNGCDLSLIADTQLHNGTTYYSNSRAQVVVTVGLPVLFPPFTKNLNVRMSVLGHRDATAVCSDVFGCCHKLSSMILGGAGGGDWSEGNQQVLLSSVSRVPAVDGPLSAAWRFGCALGSLLRIVQY